MVGTGIKNHADDSSNQRYNTLKTTVQNNLATIDSKEKETNIEV